MPTLTLRPDRVEHDAVERFASGSKATPEVMECARNRVTPDPPNPALPGEIAQVGESHRKNLPPWSDSADGPPGYEGTAGDEPEPGKYP